MLPVRFSPAICSLCIPHRYSFLLCHCKQYIIIQPCRPSFFSESALKSVFPLADGADQHAYQHSSGDGTFTHALQVASKAEAQHAGDEDEGHIKDDFHRTETDRQHFAYGERYAFAGKHDHIGADLQKDADRNQDASASSGESKNVPIPAIGIFTPLFSVTYSIFIASCLILILLYPARPQTEVSLRYEV